MKTLIKKITPRAKQTTPFPFLDLARFPAALLVIAIHISPLAFINERADFILTGIIGRVAVPFFIMVTGYFTLKPKRRRRNTFPGSTVKKIFILYVIAIALYLPVNIYAGQIPLWTNGGDSPDPLWILSLIRWIFVDGTFYHLWYFPALVTGLILVSLLLKVCSHRCVLIVAALLYIFGLMGDSYYGLASQIPALKTVYDGIFSICTYTRNGLFYVPLFLVLGRQLALKGPEFFKNGPLLLTAFLAMTGEGLILHHFDLQRHDSMYIFLPLVMYFVFCLLLDLNQRFKKNCCPCPSFKIFRRISMIMYIIHPLMIIAVRAADKLANLKGRLINNGLILYALTAALSLTAALILTPVIQRFKRS